ncbi:hypothetical protein FB192DRAFT_1353269 [Mucor lusitanicus]|uniref:Uncharacterized protein n=1 Tax=Mucor circinelloides f. lusitanicus TaxID=29924 RepID=A0A8H4BR00_MUCCL|nr:hypothetical protein FB192DRAFT_1353269 [Mucor lusitanicus]
MVVGDTPLLSLLLLSIHHSLICYHGLYFVAIQFDQILLYCKSCATTSASTTNRGQCQFNINATDSEKSNAQQQADSCWH